MPENQSQVARLRAEIEATCFSMNLAFHGFAQKASHRMINNQYKSLDQQRDRLANLISRTLTCPFVIVPNEKRTSVIL